MSSDSSSPSGSGGVPFGADRSAAETASVRPHGESETASGPAAAPSGVMLEKTGDFVGPYKLMSVLGEGGFGTVWLAERREPMVQRVALKIIKPGMDSRA
jgi:serine/threonine protein kinase